MQLPALMVLLQPFTRVAAPPYKEVPVRPARRFATNATAKVLGTATIINALRGMSCCPIQRTAPNA